MSHSAKPGVQEGCGTTIILLLATNSHAHKPEYAPHVAGRV